MRDVMEKESREVESDGGIASANFSILANGKAFRILIDGLYADKPRAIVRELWSNAYDSHRDAGKGDVPFDCHLPTRFAPHFSVRDYGVSLDHDDVMGLYATVFQSTKEKSNVGVGKFGLGSKTPFAYSDQFTVTVWKDGKKRLYNAYINEEEIPTISLFHEEDSDEPQGVEVSFAVKPQDIENFIRAAKFTIIGFDVKPNLIGAEINFSSELGVIKTSGEAWRIYEPANRYDRVIRCSVRQGCVVYPLDRGALETAFRKRDIDLSFLDTPIVMDVDIGSVEITPSRESLSYDAKTIDNVCNAIESVISELMVAYVKRINEPFRKNLVDFVSNFNDVNREVQNTLPRYFHDRIRKAGIWRGKPFRPDDYGRMGYNKSLGNIKIILCESSFRSRIPGRWRDDHCAQAINANLNFALDVSSGYTIIRQKDTDKIPYAGARIRQYMEKNRIRNNVIWFNGTDMQLKRLYVMLMRPKKFDILNLVDLERPSYAMMPSDAAKSKGTVWVKMFTIKNPIPVEARVSEKGGGIYFAVTGQNWCACGVDALDDANQDADILEKIRHLTKQPSDWLQFLRNANSLELIDEETPIYLVPRRSRRAVERGENWNPIIDYLKEVLTDNVSPDRVRNFLSYQERSGLRSEVPSYVREIISNKASFPLNYPSVSTVSEVYKYFDSLEEALTKDTSSVDGNLVNLGISLKIYSPNMEDIKNEKNAEYEKLKETIKKFELKYPMLAKHYRYGFSRDTNERRMIAEYINIVDRVHAMEMVEIPSEFPEE